MSWDVFLSHASEDKPFVRVLVEALIDAGVTVWLDELELHVGDSISESIDKGLARSRFGVVVVSPSFLRKFWTNYEIRSLIAKESRSGKTILPVWHDVSATEVAEFSLSLADRYAVTTDKGVGEVAYQIARVVAREGMTRPARPPHEIELADGSSAVLVPLSSLQDEGKVWALAKQPVTNAQYSRFLQAKSGVREPHGEHYVDGQWAGPFYPWRDPEFSGPDQPVVCLSLAEATAYCDWVSSLDADGLNQRVELPTSTVWRFAAYGRSGSDITSDVTRLQPQIHHRARSPAPVDHSGVRTNASGVSDLFGNVWEWVVDTASNHLQVSVLAPRLGDQARWRRRVSAMGGSFLDDLTRIIPIVSSDDLRDKEQTRHSDLGFRIAARIALRDLPEQIRLSVFTDRSVTFPQGGTVTIR
jgi:hypothetical protein